MDSPLKRAHLEAAQRFIDVFRPLQAEFETALAACPPAEDTSPAAEAARERVRAALIAGSGPPGSPLAAARDAVDRAKRAMIVAGLADM